MLTVQSVATLFSSVTLSDVSSKVVSIFGSDVQVYWSGGNNPQVLTDFEH